MGKGFGYAKTILLGEHFVVYGLPAIGAALSKKIEIEVTKAPHMKIEAAHADGKLLLGLEAAKKSMKITENFNVKIKSEIPIGSGLGSSAALSVAFVRAVADESKMFITDHEISKHAYESERVFHGVPSGIDNTLATQGGAILFQKTQTGAEITPLKIGRPLNLVIGNTGKKRGSTEDIISAVKARRDKNPEIYNDLFNAEKKMIDSAVTAISSGKIEDLGEFMNINHGLLCSMGVSSRENEMIIYAARDLGALGAKITGAGCGGSCTILAKNEKNAEEIANEIRKLGFIAITSLVQ
ncbi:mevalonate kinase [Candidatus Micrarchaeota archaeon]|nr:mevalonate kinase [Candidatus Micrarchaeota archaeon]